ncbi:MAG: UDP-N-acetylmuramate dehydrogenase [Treponema sp.]
MNNLREIAQNFKTDSDFAVFEDEPMARRFSFKVGGKTELLIEPLSENALIKCVNILEENEIPYFILGGGTNIVFSDDGFKGAVISTVRLNKIEEIKTGEKTAVLKCQCGVLMNSLVNFAVKKCYSGLEAFCGLPGTAGGACYMNARCFNLEVSDVVKDIEYLRKEKAPALSSAYKKNILHSEKSMWEYKKSPFTNSTDIILGAEFMVTKESNEMAQEIAGRARDFMRERIEKGHFKFPCAGSVFKNNRAFGKPTGQIIDELGLKGHSVGGAKISDWHGNIIINTGNATQGEIKQLVDFIKTTVREKTGFELEEEIIFK